MSPILSIAMTFATVIGLTILLTGVRASRIRLKSMRSEPIDLARVPQATRAVLDIGRDWLRPRGFRYLSSWKTRPMIANATEWKYSDVYAGDDEITFAVVSPREQPRPGDIVAVEFQSVFANGVVMSTFNRYRHAIVWEPPAWKISDDYVSDLSQALENHRQRVRDCGMAPLSEPAERDRIANGRAAVFVGAMVESGQAHRLASGEVRMRFIPALKYAMKLLQGNSRAAKVRIVPLGAPAAAGPGAAQGGETAGVAADMHSYFTRRAMSASATSTGKLRFGALSAIAFVAVGAFLWDPVFALILLSVIAFHEGGHYLVMKAVGYRNLHVFFVPGLGGLATGEKQDASVAQKVLVYLAGPMPGIALATAGFIALPAEASSQYPWMHQLLMVMLSLNLINLLPVTPLDGGRVVEVLLFMRWPRLRVVFTAVSAAALIGVGALLGERGMLIIGVLVALALPAQWRFSRLARAIRRAPGEMMDEQPAARRVFTALAAAPFMKWTYQHRAVAADELIGQLRTPVPGVVAVALGLMLYAGCFFAPIVAAIAASPGMRETVSTIWEARDAIGEEQGPPTARAPQRDWATELAQTRQAPPERRLALLTEATEAGFIPGTGTEEDLKASRAEMRRIAEQLPRGNVARVHALFVTAMDDDEQDAARNQSELRPLMEELIEATPEAAALRGRIGFALASTMQSSPERLQLLKQSRDGMLGNGKPGDTYLGEAWSELAGETAKQGDPGAAEAEWRALLTWCAGVPADNWAAHVCVNSARMGYSSFLIRQARFDDAEAFLRPSAEAAAAQAAQGKRAPLMRSYWQMEDLLWMAIRKGDAAQASKWLDAWGHAPGEKRNPRYVLAQLATADSMHDEKGAEQARRRIADLPGKLPSLCQAQMPKYEGTELGVKRAALISRYELCKGRAA
jgi:Zn-dependent protease